MSDEQELPPGYQCVEKEVRAARYHKVYFPVEYTEWTVWDGCGGFQASSSRKSRADAVRLAWDHFTRSTGIYRERWNRFQRDHKAMELLRELPNILCFEDLEVVLEPLRLSFFNDEDPADAIIKALGGKP